MAIGWKRARGDPSGCSRSTPRSSAGRAPGGRRPDRSTRRMGRRPRSGCRDRLGSRGAHACRLRAEGGDRSLRRRLAGERVAVGTGPQPDPAQLRRPLQLRADRRRPLLDADHELARIPRGRRQGGGDPPLRPAHLEGGGAASRRFDLTRRPHGACDCRGEEGSDGDGRRRRQAEGQAAPARDEQRLGQPHRSVGDVVGLQRRQPHGDDEVRALLLAGDAGDPRARFRLARRRRPAAAADDARPPRLRRAARAADARLRDLDLGHELRAHVRARPRHRLRTLRRPPLPRRLLRLETARARRGGDHDGHRRQGRPLLRASPSSSPSPP